MQLFEELIVNRCRNLRYLRRNNIYEYSERPQGIEIQIYTLNLHVLGVDDDRLCDTQSSRANTRILQMKTPDVYIRIHVYARESQ